MAGKRLALIVATDRYRDPGLRQLRTPGTDAEALAKVLGDPELGEFEVDVLRNEDSSTIAERVEMLLTAGKPDDLIVLHFSCHGLKDDSGELYLAATNTRPGLLASTAIDAALVNRLMRRSRAQRVVLFLDCCYGGAFERGMVPRAAGVVDVADQFQQRESELSSGRGRVVITASNAMEFAFEGNDLADSIAEQPSIFTGALVEGLTTGEADRDQDGMVSLGELYDYVFERVRAASPNQTPGKWEFGLQGDLYLAKNPQRVVVAAPVPADLLELVEHPFPATRLGSVEALSRLAEGASLSIAAGARGVLQRMTEDDSRSVASAATEALEKTGLRLSTTDVDFGTVERGSRPTADVVIEGVPLATASRVEASIPELRVRRLERTVRIELDASVPGRVDGIVMVYGPAGSAQVRVFGVVSDGPAQVGSATPGAAASPAEPEPAASASSLRSAPPPDAAPGPDLSGTAAASAPRVQEALRSAKAKLSAPTVSDEPAAVRLPIARRAALRGFLGAVIGVVFGALGFYVVNSQYLAHLPGYVLFYLKLMAVDAVVFAGSVALAEWFLPAARVPVGEWVRAFRGRAIGVAALQGAVTGATVGFLVFVVLGGQVEWLVLPFVVLGPTLGFAVAERLLMRRTTVAHG